jgi:hypothetical protein
MARRSGWTRLRSGCAGIWRHDSGWVVRHCGHPTALWPYYGVPPGGGEMLLAPSGHGFQTLALAQAAVEARTTGRELSGPEGGGRRTIIHGQE